MFPIRDHNPSRRIPYITLALVVINVGVFLLITLPISVNDIRLGFFYREWGVVPAYADPSDYITSLFLHGSFMHLTGNMLFLWVFGDNMEDEMGHIPYLLFYLASGVAATLLHVWTNPNSGVPLVGASGAIAGVMGGYLLLYPRARVDVFFFIVVRPIPAWIVLVAWFGIQLWNGASTASESAGVAYWAHVGGFAVGILGTLPWWLKEGASKWWKRTEGHPPHPETHYEIKGISPTNIPRVGRKK
ncbi:rhomboid family intramembrane serine protease [Vannielia sp.]|uniref:rhomboid family intramembrane serine protease n=1 Tax=Vannielia sp. TaxID=2813045 RepID=UPI0026104993|nr:rhomboid family intramembrane serine protease [Vannielia sp.]MDF1871938.1 rhomboid family intramembrane serine protease [Vannielia sp.]